jgi:hypothetical protein
MKSLTSTISVFSVRRHFQSRECPPRRIYNAQDGRLSVKMGSYVKLCSYLIERERSRERERERERSIIMLLSAVSFKIQPESG